MDKMDLHKGGNGGKITARGICHYFCHPSTFHCLVYQIIVLKHPPPPVPIEIVKKNIDTGLHILHQIQKSYRI